MNSYGQKIKTVCRIIPIDTARRGYAEREQFPPLLQFF